jgi:hypothetical protein
VEKEVILDRQHGNPQARIFLGEKEQLCAGSDQAAKEGAGCSEACLSFHFSSATGSPE